MAVRDRVTPEGKKFFKMLEELATLEVRIGFQKGDATYTVKKKGGTQEVDIADVAAWNELGTDRGIPPRPFIRQSFDNNKAMIKAMCDAQAKAIITGKADPKKALNAIGAMQKGLIQKTIDSGGFAPNDPKTIKRKKSSKPLIDTGLMRQSVNYVIKKKGS